MAADSDCGQPGIQHPHLLISLPSLDPHQCKGLSGKGSCHPWLPPQPHPLTLLKDLKKRWEVSPQEHYHVCSRWSPPHPPQSTRHLRYSAAPRGLRTQGCKASSQLAVRHSSGRRGRGCSRFSSHLCHRSRLSASPTPTPKQDTRKLRPRDWVLCYGV